MQTRKYRSGSFPFELGLEINLNLPKLWLCRLGSTAVKVVQLLGLEINLNLPRLRTTDELSN